MVTSGMGLFPSLTLAYQTDLILASSIVVESPILFSIYMLQLDKIICNPHAVLLSIVMWIMHIQYVLS